MKPILFVLAAGMGSRYGGIKQLDGVGPHGETIMDYSIYDALQAGFGKVVFVIRHDIEDDFRSKILSKYEGHIPVDVVFQAVDKLPEGSVCPAGRTKPWGTNHALLMAAGAIDRPFAVINSDDFYGRDAFEAVARELMRPGRRDDEFCMVGFRVGNTMSPNGSVSRGVCATDADGYLQTVTERTAIRYDARGDIVFTDEHGADVRLDPMTPVSMNLWGLTPAYFGPARREFERFLDANIGNPKAEMAIPPAVDALIKSGEASVKVLDTTSRWFGVTYQADRPGVVDRLAELHATGVYPDRLF